MMFTIILLQEPCLAPAARTHSVRLPDRGRTVCFGDIPIINFYCKRLGHLQQGINIVRYASGKVVKMLKK